MKFETLTTSILAALATSTIACGGITGTEDDDDGNVAVDAGQADAMVVDPDAAELAIAPFDNDSLAAPAQDVFLSITGTREFTHSDEVSFPEGDLSDFVQFNVPQNSNPIQNIRVTLECAVTGQTDAQLSAVLYEDDELSTTKIICNDGEQTISINNTKTQSLEVTFSVVADASHASYDLTVDAF